MAPKRSHSAAGETSTKKARFASPSEDPQRFADQVEEALENASGRKGKVKTDGYDSDSTDDGEGVVFSRRKEEGDDDDDDDMFADPATASAGKETTKGKGKTKFMNLGDIEGQEFDDEDDEDDGSAEDEDDAERKKKAGMGYEITRFHMKDEMEEGKFDADGTFVRSFDQHVAHDRWIEGTSEKEMKRARLAKKKREQEDAEKEEREENNKSKEQLELELVQILRKGEDVLEALARLGKTKPTKAKQKKALATSTRVDVNAASSGGSDIERITELASTLMGLGETDIYSTSYEALLRSVRRSGLVSQDWMPPVPKFEYIWAPQDGSAPKPDAETYGPYDREQMEAWNEAQYFGDGADKILVRVVGENQSWKSWSDVVD